MEIVVWLLVAGAVLVTAARVALWFVTNEISELGGRIATRLGGKPDGRHRMPKYMERSNDRK